MISGVLKTSKDAIGILEKEIRAQAAYYTNEQVRIIALMTRSDLMSFLEKKQITDIIFIDVSLVNGIPEAELLREYYPKAAIIVIADVEMSPISYLKPSILAASLLLKPLTGDMVHNVIRDIFSRYIDREVDEEIFLIETREEKHRIPLSAILYFEAREKKIYACTDSEEYGFYETMDHLAERMQSQFIRCHRSYLANISMVNKVMLSKNLILLKQGIELPLSRSYKSDLKQFQERR